MCSKIIYLKVNQRKRPTNHFMSKFQNSVLLCDLTFDSEILRPAFRPIINLIWIICEFKNIVDVYHICKYVSCLWKALKMIRVLGIIRTSDRNSKESTSKLKRAEIREILRNIQWITISWSDLSQIWVNRKD